MIECKYCELRKAFAIVYDVHWLDEHDCPLQLCPYNVTKGEKDDRDSD